MGYTAGTAANYLLQTYKPELYDAIGGTLNRMVERLQNATDDATKGNLEKAIADLFSFDDAMIDTFETTGGDYLVCEAWAEVADQGRALGPLNKTSLDSCPILGRIFRRRRRRHVSPFFGR